jgi:hypothetical protein
MRARWCYMQPLSSVPAHWPQLRSLVERFQTFHLPQRDAAAGRAGAPFSPVACALNHSCCVRGQPRTRGTPLLLARGDKEAQDDRESDGRRGLVRDLISQQRSEQDARDGAEKQRPDKGGARGKAKEAPADGEERGEHGGELKTYTLPAPPRERHTNPQRRALARAQRRRR